VKRNVRQNKQLASLAGANLVITSTLEWVTDKDGNERFKITNNQTIWGQNVGKSIHLNCFLCQKYLDPDGETSYKQTMFRYCECKMPLCKKDHSNPTIGRLKSGANEHAESDCKVVGCLGNDCQYTVFRKENQVQLVSRRRSR
jgi:hypothetical protein